MIRRTGLISRVGGWSPSDATDTQSVDAAWRDWANCETIKWYDEAVFHIPLFG